MDGKPENEAVKEGKSQFSQWTLPKMDGMMRGLVSDHYTWMWTPSSLMILAASYFNLKIAEVYLSKEMVLPVALWVPNLVLYWLLSLCFLCVDYSTAENGKLFIQRTSVNLQRIVMVVLRNHLLTLILAPPAVATIFKYFDRTPLTTTNESFVWILVSMFVLGGIFEIVFWLGHYMEHLSPSLYKQFHLLHHTTKADTAISGYYMTFGDYCAEGLIPMLACTVATAAFNLSPTALCHQIMLNVVYAVTVHSGWLLPGFPHPGDHWIHHTKVAPRGQGINYGTHFNLMDTIMNTQQKYQ